MTPEASQQKVDLRVYVGILFFRWKIIVLLFLYCLLGGVLYLNLAPKQYRSECKVMVYRDPNLDIARVQSPWAPSAHTYLLTSEELGRRVLDRLQKEWGERMGGVNRMLLPVTVARFASIGQSLAVSVLSENPGYGEAFLGALLEEHRKEWESMQADALSVATKTLSDEMVRMEEKVRTAEDDQIEYQRLHDVARVDARASLESRYLEALVGRRGQIETELMLLEAQFPQLKGAGVGLVADVHRQSRKTGGVEAIPDDGVDTDATATAPQTPLPAVRQGEDLLPDEFKAGKVDEGVAPESRGWPELRVKLATLEQREQELLQNLKPDHPQVKQVRDEIASVKSELDVAAQVEMQRLRDRYDALKMQMSAVEAAEYRWQAKNLLARQRRAEYKRLEAVVSRHEASYQTLYQRLQDLRVSEGLRAEHLRIVEPVKSSGRPVWPDPLKVLLMALAVGLGSGFGLALLLQVTDNKVQSISDVEKTLGVPFLGGVPYWAHSGLEKAIRPIVTEENASGAVEAYRALRTSLLASLAKINEKIVLVTSADSREGKTLTVLNIAIMIAQMGKKVLLVDMDLRRGRLHRSLGAAREPGMTDALRAGNLSGVIQQTRVQNLWLIPTGSAVEGASELMQSSDLIGLFAKVHEDFDYILVDTSPVLRVTDTVIAATQGLGVVVYVARVNKTSKPMIQYSLDMLKDSRVLGLIMNSIEMHRLSSLYYAYQYPNYAYYSNAYVYGYNYHHDEGPVEPGGWGGGIAGLWQRKMEEFGGRLHRLMNRE